MRWALLPAICASFLLLFSCEDLLQDLDAGITRESLVDTWKVEETQGGYKSSEEVYWVEISLHPSDTARLIIYNFYNIDADAEAILLNGTRLDLPAQELEGGYTVNGSGEIQGNRGNQILWTYMVDDGSGIPVQFNATYTRLTF